MQVVVFRNVSNYINMKVQTNSVAGGVEWADEAETRCR
jgi:hypothetical protein